MSGKTDLAPGEIDPHYREDLGVSIIKAAILQRLRSVETSELRGRLEIFIKDAPSRILLASSSSQTLPGTPAWVRRISLAIFRFRLVHWLAKKAYESTICLVGPSLRRLQNRRSRSPKSGKRALATLKRPQFFDP